MNFATKSTPRLNRIPMVYRPYPWVILGLSLGLLGCQDLQTLVVPPQILGGGINSQFSDQHPAFSSNGRYLALASDRAYSRKIYLYDLKEKRFVDLPNLNRTDSSQDQPALSAEGRYIAYVSTERGRPDVFVYDRTQGRSQLLTATVRGSVRHPTLSGDGKFVAYESNRLGQWHIEIYDRSGQMNSNP
jgi:Tol biopolymer transport system component